MMSYEAFELLASSPQPSSTVFRLVYGDCKQAKQGMAWHGMARTEAETEKQRKRGRWKRSLAIFVGNSCLGYHIESK